MQPDARFYQGAIATALAIALPLFLVYTLEKSVEKRFRIACEKEHGTAIKTVCIDNVSVIRLDMPVLKGAIHD